MILIFVYNSKMSINEYLKIGGTCHMGRGLFASKDIPMHTEILSIHKKDYISYQHLLHHKYLSKICGETNSKIAQFAFFLAFINKSNQNTPQYPLLKQYLQQLPPYYNNLICWDQEQLNQLDNPQLIQKTRLRRKQLQIIYQQLLDFKYHDQKQKRIEVKEENVFEGESKRGNRKRKRQPAIHHQQAQNFEDIHLIKQISFDDFINAYAGIQSRNSYFENHHDNNSEVGALIQQLELFNHSKHAKCVVQRYISSYRLTTTHHITEGEQVFVNYGQNFTVDQFLELYGMIPQNNQYQSDGFLQQKQNEKQVQKSKIGMWKSISQQRQELALRYNRYMSKSVIKQQAKVLNCYPLGQKNEKIVKIDQGIQKKGKR